MDNVINDAENAEIAENTEIKYLALDTTETEKMPEAEIDLDSVESNQQRAELKKPLRILEKLRFLLYISLLMPVILVGLNCTFFLMYRNWVNCVVYALWGLLFLIGLAGTLLHIYQENQKLVLRKAFGIGNIMTLVLTILLAIGCCYMEQEPSSLWGKTVRYWIVDTKDRDTDNSNITIGFDEDTVTISYNVYTYIPLMSSKVINNNKSSYHTYPYEYNKGALYINDNSYSLAENEDGELHFRSIIRRDYKADLLAFLLYALDDEADFLIVSDKVDRWDYLYSMFHNN